MLGWGILGFSCVIIYGTLLSGRVVAYPVIFISVVTLGLIVSLIRVSYLYVTYVPNITIQPKKSVIIIRRGFVSILYILLLSHIYQVVNILFIVMWSEI